MKNHKSFLLKGLIILLFAISMICMIWGMINDSDLVNVCAAISTMGLVCTAVYGFRSNRDAIRLQTSMSFSLDVYKTIHSNSFKKRERNIQNKLSSLQDRGIICSIEEIDDADLKKDIHIYCGYMDCLGILVMEHLINPEVILYNTGVGLLRTFFLLKPYLELTRKKRKENASHDIKDKIVDEIISEGVQMYYANFELLAMEMRRRGPQLINDLKEKMEVARKNKMVIKKG